MDNPAKDTSTQADAQKEVRNDQKGRRKRGRTVHIKDITLLLWNKKYVILFFFLLVMSITAIYTFKTPREYKATTRLVIEKETLDIFSSKSLVAYDTSAIDYFNTQCKILKSSRTLAENVIAAPPRKLKVVSRSGEERPMAPGELLNKVVVTALRDTRLVDVSVIDGDPKQAASIANTLAQEFIKFTVLNKFKARNAAAGMIQKELESLAIKVKDAEKSLNDFKQRNRVVSDKPEQNPIYNTLTALTAEVSLRRKDTIVAEQVYVRLQNLSPEELLQQKEIADDKVIQQLQSNLLSAENQLGLLSQFYGPKHPKYAAAKDFIQKVKDQVTAATQSVRDKLREAWTAAKENETRIVTELNKAREEAEKQDAVLAEYHRFQMDTDTKKATYQDLLRRGTEGTVETGVTREPTQWDPGTSNIRVVDEAIAPGRPFRPRPLMNMSLAAFIGLFLGAGAAFLLVYLDDKVRNPDDVTEDLGRMLLAEIPVARGKLASWRLKGTLAYDHPNSGISEAYRNLRTSIELMASDGKFPSLLVTSACPGEGKTTTATNLAITIAKRGKKVLLVDTDMRRPRIHRYFDIDESKGLIGYLSGDLTLDEAIADRSQFAQPKHQEDKVAHVEPGELKILPCGARRVYNPTEVLGSRKMQDFIADLKKMFDVVIFDSPPCRFSDPLILAKNVDAILVIIEAGKFPKPMIAQGLENLDKVANKVFGVVLNKYDPRKSGGYGYYGYRNYYYQRYYSRYYYYYYYDRGRRGGLLHRLTHKRSTEKPARATQQAEKSPSSENFGSDRKA